MNYMSDSIKSIASRSGKNIYGKIFKLSNKEMTTTLDELKKIAVKVDEDKNNNGSFEYIIKEIRNKYDHWYVKNRQNKIQFCIFITAIVYGIELYNFELMGSLQLISRKENEIIH